MNTQTELGRYMKAAGSNSAEPAGRHLSEQEMIALYQGQMPEAEHETNRAHLAYCPECLQLWRDVRDFCAPGEEGEVEAGDFEVRREWKELWRRIQAEPQTATTVHTEILAPPSPFALRFVLPMAAGIALTIGLSAVTLFWQQERRQRIEAQEAAARLQASQQELQSRVAQLEQNSNTQSQLEDQLKQEHDRNQELLAQLNERNQPQTNNRIDELQLPGSNARSNKQNNQPAPEIPVPASSKSWVLRITPDKPEEFSDYAIKITDHQNTAKWESGRLKLGPDQTLLVIIPSGFLSKGKYHVLVYGRNASGLKLLEKYEVRYGER